MASVYRSIWITICGLFLLGSCSKENKNGGNQVNRDTMRFDLTGFADASMLQTDTLVLPVNIDYLSGGKKNVSLAISVLPAGMNLSIIPQIDTPDYQSMITLIAHNVTTGSYPVTLVATSSEISKTYFMMLRVDTIPLNPALPLVGAYIETGSCSATGTKNNHASVIIYNGNNHYNEILIRDFWTTAGNIDVVAVIDPASKTLAIASQQVGLLTISGTGSYTTNTVNLSYVVTDGNIVHDTCATVLTRQP